MWSSSMDPELVTVATTLGLYAAVVISPGPNFALVSRLAVSGARRRAGGATLGLAVAATFYAILTMTGMALVLARVGWLASLVQVAGGCYLVYLGLLTWWSSSPTAAFRRDRTEVGGAWRGFRTGCLVNLSNPKGIAFFIGLYATAIPPETGFSAKLAILFGGFMLEIVWYGLVILCLSSRPARQAYGQFGRWIERGLGILLAAFGVRLISERL